MKKKNDTAKENIYSFSARSLQGEEIEMSRYKGKLILVVNTASRCGLTPQYEGLEKLYQDYKDEGLVILGFPCNQFGKQEPGNEKAIEQGCVLHYGVSFPMFAKVKVNGPEAHPLFRFLKEQLGGFLSKKIKWNFTKFLVDQNGIPLQRYAPITRPEKLRKDIEKALRSKK